MSKRKFLFLVSLILAIAVFAWVSDDVLAQAKGAKGVANEKVAKDVAAKGKVTSDDVAAYLGKVTPTERKAAAMRARQLGLKPGIAGRAAQAPAPSGTR